MFRLNRKVEKTILRVYLQVTEDLTRRTVKDDLKADRSVRQEVGFVSRVVCRLFWATRCAGLVASLCQRTIVEFAPQNGRGYCIEVQEGASYVTTILRNDQVG